MSNKETTIAIVAACLSVASAALAQQPPVSAHPAVANTAVTTTGGTVGTIPYFNGISTVLPSSLYFNSTGLGIGRTPGAMLDVNGRAIIRGALDISRSADATPVLGAPSWPFYFQSSAYNSASKVNILPYFQFQSEPTSNNTASPGATMNILYNNGTSNTLETGLYFNPDGTIHFAPGQTFPFGSTGITAVQHDNTLYGSGTSASPLGLASVRTDSTLSGSGTSTSPLQLTSPLVLPGTVSSQGFSGSNYNSGHSAVEGDDYSNTGIGVRGQSFNEGSGFMGYGMVAEGNIGIYALGTQYAASLDGDVYVSGTLSKAGGSFKIDDPIDPENKYLSHSFVESPDMKNIYDGNVTTDGKGEAIVYMPSYFEALNTDFRYQLTVIGQFAQAIVGSKISGNTFIIKTDKPNVEVSWQVTGVRQDAWANAHRIPNEELKAENEKGHYLHPELYGHAGEASISEIRQPRRPN